MFRKFSTLALIFTVQTSSATAHEYYLMPEEFAPAVDQEFAVHHRLGQKFKGNVMPYIERWNIRSEVWENGNKRKVEGLDGDRPALKIKGTSKGLMSIVHQSNIDFLTFKTWEKFVNYTNKEGISHAQSASIEGRKPKVDLKEAYARYAKTLVNIGDDASGTDVVTGLKIELVALASPAALSQTEKMPIKLLYDGKPLAGASVKVFVGIDTEFSHLILTDEQGKIEVPAQGKGPYLLNAIHMTEPQSPRAIERKAHWESFWASLTFQRQQ